MTFLYFSTLSWDEAGGAINQTQSSLELARRGHSIVFVEPQPSATREVGDLPIQVVALTELGMTPIELRRAWFGLPSGNLDTVAQKLLRLVKPEAERAAVYCAPFEPYVRLIPLLRANGFKIVYDAMDDYAAAPALGYTQFDADAEAYLARESDLIVAVTAPIAKTFARIGKHADVLPNGINVSAWSKNSARAPELKRGEITIGFWGTLMESMFDAELIAYVAEKEPRWMIHLLGRVDPEPHRPSIAKRLAPYPNVIFHGLVPHSELRGYATVFDVCVAALPDNAFTHGRDPVKIYEYLAAHVPVVTTYTSQLENMPYVRVAQSPDEFVDAIRAAAQEKVDGTVIDAFLAANSWSARVEGVLKRIHNAPRPAQNGASAEILPSFAKPDSAAFLRYIQTLEVELEQVQNWAREMQANALARRGPMERVRQLFRVA